MNMEWLFSAILLGVLIRGSSPACVRSQLLKPQNGTIQYSGISKNDKCTWILPDHGKEDSYAIILHLKSIHMFYRSAMSYLTCSGTLNIPGKGSVCSRNLPYCRVYTTTNSSCTLAQLQTHSYQECKSFMWHTLPELPHEITFAAEKRVQKSFTLDYVMINCNLDETASTSHLGTGNSTNLEATSSVYSTSYVTTTDKKMRYSPGYFPRQISVGSDEAKSKTNLTGPANNNAGFDATSFITAIALLCLLLLISGIIMTVAYLRHRGGNSTKEQTTLILNVQRAEQEEQTEPIYATINQPRISISVSESREMTMNVIYGQMPTDGDQSLQIPLSNAISDVKAENLYSTIRRKSSVQSNVAQADEPIQETIENDFEKK